MFLNFFYCTPLPSNCLINTQQILEQFSVNMAHVEVVFVSYLNILLFIEISGCK